MSPFHRSLVGLVLAGAAVGVFLDGPLRVWLGVVLAGLYVTMMVQGVFRIQAGFFVKTLCRGSGDQKRVALTFDDGPDPESTPAVLDVLAECGCPAAFFCVGQKVLDHPDLVRRMDREGHVIGNHSHRHGWWTNFLWGERLRTEIRNAQDAIASAAGHKPRFYRPPVGLTNPHLPGALKAMGLDCIGFEVRPYDRTRDIDGVLKRIMERVRPGSVVLLHDGGQDPAHRTRLVRTLIQRLTQHGYRIERLDHVLGRPPYQQD